MLRFPLFGCVIAALMAPLVPASAGEIIAVDSGNPPFMYDASGHPAGLYPALVREAFKRMKQDVQIVAVPWKRALAGINDSEHGIAGIYTNAERLEKYDFSAPIFEETIIVYSEHPFQYTGIDSLKGHAVGVLHGWSYGDAFDGAVKAGLIKTEGAAGDAANFKKLALGRLDAVLAIREAASAVIASSELSARVKANNPPLMASKTYIAFNKSAKKQDVLTKFNEALASMRADGSLEKISASVFSAGNS